MSDSILTSTGPITHELTVTSSWINDYAHISIQPPSGVAARAPCDICCVVDVSGSMSTEVEIQGAANKEKSGLSQLDLVKHALKTIVYALTANDRLSIVSFSTKASIVTKLTQMDEDGRTNALDALDKLRADGYTNLWDGLKTGLEVLVEEQRPSGSNTALFLLTDGVPSENPAEGYLPALAAHRAKSNFTCSINTFGFGYALDSKLLDDLAQAGNSGSYAFIPDGSFVGTIFVNAMSNLLTTTATNLRLTVNGISPLVESTATYVGNYPTGNLDEKSSETSDLCINMGSVIFGQSRDIVIPMNEDHYNKLHVSLDYESPYGEKKKQCKSITKLPGDVKLSNQQKHRLEFVYFVRKGYEALRGDVTKFDSYQRSVLNDIRVLEETIRNDATDDQYLTDLLADLTGQVAQAFSRHDWFTKWGIHYLPSIARAHLLQQCNNFKDPGVQHYGKGELFNSVRDEMDEIFCGLPAPKSAYTSSSTSASGNANSASLIDMSAFNNSDNPCFHGSCVVKLFDDSMKLVKDIRRGDRLYPHGATVNYVLRTTCSQGRAQMVLLDGGLIITPWHPIRLNGIQWSFPCSLVPSPTNIQCEAVYSFTLNEGHTVWINDIECVTLGHGWKEDIVRHVYYGSERVIEDLRIMDGEQKCTGLIDIEAIWVMRNKRTGRVNGIRAPQTIVIQ